VSAELQAPATVPIDNNPVPIE